VMESKREQSGSNDQPQPQVTQTGDSLTDKQSEEEVSQQVLANRYLMIMYG
jgi:hypothetical protein